MSETHKEYELVIEFGMWLTTRDKTIKVGASETVYDMNDALSEFFRMKGYDEGRPVNIHHGPIADAVGSPGVQDI